MPLVKFLISLSFKHLANIPPTRVIFQDSEGFMWFGTTAGLYRYDGYTLLSFKHKPDETGSLNSHEIFAIYEDKNQTLWIGTPEGLSRLDKNTYHFVNYKILPLQNKDNIGLGVLNILEDRQKDFWLATVGEDFIGWTEKRGFLHNLVKKKVLKKNLY